MDIEQLQLILEAVGEATDEARTIFFWWFAIQGLIWLGGYLLATFGMVLAYKAISRVIRAVWACNDSLSYELRRMISPNADFGMPNKNEREAILNCFKRGMKE